MLEKQPEKRSEIIQEARNFLKNIQKPIFLEFPLYRIGEEIDFSQAKPLHENTIKLFNLLNISENMNENDKRGILKSVFANTRSMTEYDFIKNRTICTIRLIDADL